MSRCPCDTPIAVQEAIARALQAIPAGQSALPRQVRSFPEVREALLASLPRQPALGAWRARNSQDLGLLLLELWAYVSDVLSFYDERIANESYLRTAQRRPSLRRLVEILGYLPAPGVAATVTLAGLAEGRRSVTLPVGASFRSDAFGDQPPQLFELTAETTLHPFKNEWSVGAVAADTVSEQLTPSQIRQTQQGLTAEVGQFLVFETLGFGLAKDRLVVVTVRNGDQVFRRASRVNAVTPFSGQDGRTYAEVEFQPRLDHLNGVKPSDITVQLPSVPAVVTRNRPAIDEDAIFVTETGTATVVYLDSVYRQLKQEDLVVAVVGNEELLLATAVGPVEMPVLIDTTGEGGGSGSEGDDEKPGPPRVTVPVTKVRLSGVGLASSETAKISFHFGLVDGGRVTTVGELELPASKLSRTEGVPLRGQPERPPDVAPGADLPRGALLISDRDGVGAQVQGRVSFGASGNSRLFVEEGSNPSQVVLKAPVNIFANLLHATRGESVFNEVLGSGDRRIAGQQFRLKRKPLTYVPASNLQGRASTLQLFVEGVRWREVRSFYACGEQDPVYIVRHDDEQNTSITFGDGVRGSRLPSGVNNVLANYRFGSGKAAPPAGAIQQLGRPVVGLRGVRSPVAAMAGTDPDPAETLRRKAPRSVLLLGRAVSPQDFEVLTSLQPGVIRAEASFAWLDSEQRAGVLVTYIGSADKSVVLSKLREQAELGLSIELRQAEAFAARLKLVLARDPAFEEQALRERVKAALCDPVSGPLAIENAPVGGQFMISPIYRAVQSVEGVVAVRSIGGGAAGESSFLFNFAPSALFCISEDSYLDFVEGGYVEIDFVDAIGPISATRRGGC